MADSIRVLNSVNETPGVVVAAIFLENQGKRDVGCNKADETENK